jgi:GNAT superfamily N-acetyltransferase
MVKLREADTDDIKTVRAILAAAAADLGTRFGLGHWSNVRTVETLRKYASKGELYLVELDSVPVGTLRLTSRKIGFYHQDWFAHPRDPAVYLFDMAVHPDSQRRGIGRSSMELVENRALHAGLRAVRLDAYGGAVGAGDFYRSCGYTLVHKGDMRGVALEYFEKTL